MQIERAQKTLSICAQTACVGDEPRRHKEATPWHPVLHLHVKLHRFWPRLLTMVTPQQDQGIWVAMQERSKKAAQDGII